MPITFKTMPPPLKMSVNMVGEEEKPYLKREVENLLKKGVIEHSHQSQGGIASPIFLRKKPDGTFRLILNLKRANEHVENFNFKMETIHTVLTLVRPSCFMASIDIKDAYYSVKIRKRTKNTLNFSSKDNVTTSLAFQMVSPQAQGSSLNS